MNRIFSCAAFVIHHCSACLLVLLSSLALAQSAEPSIPHLRKQGTATQLIVEGKPYLMLAGELHNSSASGVAYMEKVWPKVKSLNVNTVLAPVSWDLIEPREDEFDFAYLDAMIRLCRQHDQRLVILWFGSWKNGVSSYCPAWVLRDTVRFPRALGSSNRNKKPILSTLNANNLNADAKAFSKMMAHLKQVDGTRHTVLMIQVQNEVGIKPEPRDLSPEADAAFTSAVPAELMQHLEKNKKKIHPTLLARWEKAGSKMSGTWPEIFGDGPEAAEVFSAWYYARYIDQVARAGKAIYPLPMYVNAWLADPKLALNTYPSGGPVSHVHDIYRVAAPSIDLLAPDIYRADFKEILADYTRNANPLLIPEISYDEQAAARAYWAFGQHDGIGFSPFGIESVEADHPLVTTYSILRQLTPLIAQAQGTGKMVGVYRQNNEKSPGNVTVGAFQVNIEYLERLPAKHPPVGGVIIQTGEDEFIMAGYGFSIRPRDTRPGPRHTEIASVELGSFDASGKWVHELWLNGDETGANYKGIIPPFMANKFLGNDRQMILRIKTYRHE